MPEITISPEHFRLDAIRYFIDVGRARTEWLCEHHHTLPAPETLMAKLKAIPHVLDVDHDMRFDEMMIEIGAGADMTATKAKIIELIVAYFRAAPPALRIETAPA
jgi:hypothetical protein